MFKSICLCGEKSQCFIHQTLSLSLSLSDHLMWPHPYAFIWLDTCMCACTCAAMQQHTWVLVPVNRIFLHSRGLTCVSHRGSSDVSTSWRPTNQAAAAPLLWPTERKNRRRANRRQWKKRKRQLETLTHFDADKNWERKKEEETYHKSLKSAATPRTDAPLLSQDPRSGFLGLSGDQI